MVPFIDDWLVDDEVELLDVAGWLLVVAGSLVAAEGGWLADDDEADGWLLLVEPEAEAEAPPETPSAERVCWSSWPEPEMPCACWKLCNAAWVFGPILPSTGPGSLPLSFRACWTWRTWELSDEAEAEVELDIELFGAPMEVLGCAELVAELVEDDGAGWLAAIAAVIESANAARANFLIMVTSFPVGGGMAATISARRGFGFAGAPHWARKGLRCNARAESLPAAASTWGASASVAGVPHLPRARGPGATPQAVRRIRRAAQAAP